MRIYTRELNYIKSIVYAEGMQLYEDRHLPKKTKTKEVLRTKNNSKNSI
jgi:hypothetical protein